MGWLAVGVAIYVAFRRRQGLDLVSTVKVAIPQPVVDHEAEYDSVLVPILDGNYDERVMATASRLANRRRRGIHVLALVTVPNALPIDAKMTDAEAGADSVIEQGKIHGGRRVSGHVEKIRAGQAGRRIVEEASDMRAAAIVMPLPRRIDGASLFGKTLETVLAERPCRVIIESAPGPDARQAPRDDEGEPRMRGVTLVLSSAMVVIGLAIIVRTFAEGGAIAFGLLVGLLFMAAGCGRLYLERHR